MFGHFDLECFPKTSGSKGLQVYVPLNTKTDYDETKPFARAIAQLLEKQTAEGGPLEDEQGRAQGQGLRRLVPEPPAQDDDRRLLAAGARAAHRLDPGDLGRGRAGAAERDDPDLLVFEAAEVLERFEQHGDLFAPVLEKKQRLPNIAKMAG